jgi:hypothetical protein
MTMNKFWEKVKRIRRGPDWDSREHVRNILLQEAELSRGFRDFLCHAVNKGHAARVTVEVDGIKCETGLLLSAKEPLMEYLANWAARERIAKQERLSEYDKAMERVDEKTINRIMTEMGRELE